MGFAKNDKTVIKETVNQRNGTSQKTVRSKHGEIELEIPHDRAAEFEPVIIAKHQRRFDGFDDLILSLYSRRLSTRKIRAQIEKKGTMPIANRSPAMNQMAIIFEGRLPIAGCQKIHLHKIPDSLPRFD